MKSRVLLPLALVAALSLFPASALADQDGAQSTAQLPQLGALASIEEYGAALDEIKELESRTTCRTRNGKKTCKAQKLSEDDYDEAEANLSDALEELQAAVEARQEDRAQAITDWREEREAFLGDPIKARYESVQEYNEAWLEGGNYSCYADAGFSNCPAGVASGADVAINITGNPADAGKGMLDLIEEKRDNDLSGLTNLSKEGRLARCAASKNFGDKALADAEQAVKKAKGKSKKKKATDRLKKLRSARAGCDQRAREGAAPSADDEEAVNDLVEQASEDAQENRNSMDEANDTWNERASEKADRELSRGETAAERAKDKADRTDQSAYDKLERRGARALKRVEP